MLDYVDYGRILLYDGAMITQMCRFHEGDKVRVDIPDKDDPDFHHHRQTGEVVDVVEDGVDAITGDERDAILYFVELDTGGEISLRWRDLRPVQ